MSEKDVYLEDLLQPWWFPLQGCQMEDYTSNFIIKIRVE